MGDYKPVKVGRYFSKKGQDAFSTGWDGSRLEYDLREVKLEEGGKVIFEQKDVEVPKNWGQNPTEILASKYFYGRKGSSERETSAKQVFGRVAEFIASRGRTMGYFRNDSDAQVFRDELLVLMMNQAGMFNSPVLFNFGLYDKYQVQSGSVGNHYFDLKEGIVKPVPEGLAYKHPQGSACFIAGIDDSMHSIMMDGSYNYAMLFKHGSGVGSDLSRLRSSRELLTGGGSPSGPLSFMKIFDSVAAVVKSGGKTRRAAIMESLKVIHPDIMDFIKAKPNEEKKAWALIEQGYDGSFGGEAYDSVKYQNMNLSVRVFDEFMKAVRENKNWRTQPVLNKELADQMPEYPAREILKAIAEGTWICGDPGVQYDDTINRWNTCKASGRINASNPCSEFMHVDNSACNLASLNLRKFIDNKGRVDIQGLETAVRTFIIAQEIIVDAGSYPSHLIAENSHRFRPLGLGYANAGAAAMAMGLPYDSDQARTLMAGITNLITASAYATSRELGKARGHFEEFKKNKDSMLEVILMHKQAGDKIDPASLGENTGILKRTQELWQANLLEGEKTGFRNDQVSLLAPTGTIGFLMDCDTTGLEPDLALVKYKKLVGGGQMKLVNGTVKKALATLGYSPEAIEKITTYIDKKDTIEGAAELKEEHLPIFDCAFKPRNGKRFLSYQAHLKMMAAVQPFLSGAISKTINMPNESTVEEIMSAYQLGHDLGLKAVAIYREGSKRIQPLNTGRDSEKAGKLEVKLSDGELLWGRRKKLPSDHDSRTHKFKVAGHGGYYHVGFYPDGSIGELWVDVSKDGTTLGTSMRLFATAFSYMLQLGMPLEEAVEQFEGYSFEPSGIVIGNPDIHFAKSMVDYIMKDMKHKYVDGKKGKILDSPETSTAITSSEKAKEETNSKINGEEELAKQYQDFIKGRTVTDKICPNCNKWNMVALDSKMCHLACFCGHDSTEGCGGASRVG